MKEWMRTTLQRHDDEAVGDLPSKWIQVEQRIDSRVPHHACPAVPSRDQHDLKLASE